MYDLHWKISFSNLNQLETCHNKFKSFTFSINYDDKEIIKQKDIWPRGQFSIDTFILRILLKKLLIKT